MRNMIIIPCIIYIIIICTIDNNAIINNNYGRPQNFILLFKIPIDLCPQKVAPTMVVFKYLIARGLSGYRARRRVADSRGSALVAGLSLNK
jgi:hypothetical protein